VRKAAAGVRIGGPTTGVEAPAAALIIPRAAVADGAVWAGPSGARIRVIRHWMGQRAVQNKKGSVFMHSSWRAP